MQIARLVGLVFLNLVFTALIAVVVGLFLWVRLTGNLPDLQGWHLQYPESEFCAADANDDYALDHYLEQEQRVYNELEELKAGRWATQIDGAFCRFGASSVSNPETIVDRNWNRTYLLKADKPIGGVLLLHGLPSASSELFLFDINRMDKFMNLFNRSFEKAIFPKLQRTDMPFKLSVLKNSNPDSRQMLLQTRKGESWTETMTDYSWPTGVASLSHLAVPIPPEDLIYGTKEATATRGLPLGTLSMRAEPSSLLISNSLFYRCRNNPFYHIMEDHVVKWLSGRILE